MKTKLPFLLLLLSLVSFGQTPISTYYSLNGSTYAVVSSSSTIDQTTTGAGLTWNFNTFTQTDTDLDTYTTPTGPELTTFPGTTNVLTVTNSSSGENKIFSADVNGTTSLTGATRDDIILNYSTNNALIGTFPMSYSATNSDAVAGTFIYTTYNGTFTGTINTEVDAYGTLNMNDLGEGAYSGSVTRLKTVQNLSMTALGFSNIGTVTQTAYNYYDNITNELVFRSLELNVVVPILSINESVTLMESILPLSTLNINQNDIVALVLSIIPNPVADVLNIHLSQNESIRSITLTDIKGRQVLSVNENLNSISVSRLQAGMYIANITTDKGVYTKKFLKK
ncbi:T9SS type A sorting domain-containing protein [Bizionia arctica]|uniref:Secretion system C-terminal sorting domain-containing protein n=1 Tax=Bizionia arctica TaxID=1495645 RepID=A0A917GUK0_9FLAO|nr:T9SS type A sorting domain-containing protein [Bizionia arctica]GGG57228.1 hypothetical protein GCM10010976_30090 [Bizionia arctica]